MNSDIYERLRKEDENFIKTLIRLKQKMNNSQTNYAFHISDNKKLSSKNINSNQNNSNLISLHKNKKEKPIKITSYNTKVKKNDTRNKKNLSSNSIQNQTSVSSKQINEYKKKNKSNTIINNYNDIIKTRTINIISKKKNEINKDNSIKVQSINKSSNISKDNINQLYKKNFVHEYQIRKKATYDLSIKFNFKNNVPVAFIDLSDSCSINNIKHIDKKGNKIQLNKKSKI